jgi:hypothetical protein
MGSEIGAHALRAAAATEALDCTPSPRSRAHEPSSPRRATIRRRLFPYALCRTNRAKKGYDERRIKICLSSIRSRISIGLLAN